MARALQNDELRDRAAFAHSYEYLQNSLRARGPRETPEGFSFFADDLDVEQLDEVIAGIG